MPEVSPRGVSVVGSVLGATVLNVAAGSIPPVSTEPSVPAKLEAVEWTASVVETTLDVLE
jgi:hypothetical protein